jgi:hypothetical protein
VSGPPRIPQEVDGAEKHEGGLAGVLLILLALVLPFEVPLFRVGPLLITSVELVLYVTIAAWGLAVAWEMVRGRLPISDAAAALRADPLAQATVLWAVVLFVSALTTPSYRGAAFKFAMRSLSGILVFFAARSLGRTPESGRRVVLALLVGALGSAGTALVEGLVPGTPAFFRASSFDALGLERSSGVFEYPTMGAMYWEAAVPLALVAPFLLSAAPERGPWKVGLAVLASVPLFGAILASATRSGLAGAAMVCACLVALGRSSTGLRLSSALVLGGGVLLWLAVSATGSLLGQRLRWWQDDTWFRAECEVLGEPPIVRVGETFTVPLRLRNTGTLAWRSDGERPFRLGYHWEPVGRSVTRGDFEGQRTEFPAVVPPGGSVDLVAVARGPDSPGVYLLQWDLDEEGVTWFSERGNRMPVQSVLVQDAREGATPIPPEVRAARARPVPLSALPPAPRPLLWRAALDLWRSRPLLGVGPDNYRRLYEDVIGPVSRGRTYSDTRIHANSLYFETLADLGLAGIAALLWIALALLRALRDASARGRIGGLGCGMAAGAFFVHGCFDYFFEFTPLFGLFWMVLGLTAASARGPRLATQQGSLR